MQYRRDIDGLRAVAVTPVVLFHAGLSWFSGGFVGVDVFFVISGFLITGILLRELDAGAYSLVHFYERRCRRILPALTLVVVGTLIAGWFILFDKDFLALAKSAISSALFASNFYFLLTWGYFSGNAEFLPLLHTWSLAVEEQFYIFFPPLLYIVHRFLPRRMLFHAILLISIVSLGLAVYLTGTWSEAAFYLLPTRAWELGTGSLLAIAWERLPAPGERLATTAGAFGLAAIMVPVFTYDPQTPFPGLAAIPPVLGTALVLWAGKGGRGLTTSLLSSAPLVGIGLISYSWYLWHWPILSLMRIEANDVVLGWGAASVAIIVSAFGAWFSYRFIESPFRRKPPTGLRRGPVFVLSGAMLAAMVLAGLTIVWQRGIPSRIPAAALAYSNGAKDVRPGSANCPVGSKKPACDLGQAAASHGDFLLWGDSHSGAISPAFDTAAREAGLSGRLASHTACPPVFGYESEYRNRRGCVKFKNSIKHTLETSHAFPVVFIDARWATSVEGTRYGEETGNELNFPPELRAKFPEYLQATVDFIRGTGRQVVLVGPTPEVGWSVPDGLARAEWRGRPLPQGPTKAAAEARNRRSIAILRHVAASDPGVRYVSLLEQFCDVRCRVMVDHRSVYFDDDHLSKTGAIKLVAPALAPVMAQIAR